MSELQLTGERVIADDYQKSVGGYVIYMMHIASYRFVEKLCFGKRVLDLGCGSGYGTALVGEVAASVHGVDVSVDAIAFANRQHGRDGIAFSVIDPNKPLPFADGIFDVVLSFQVLEHVANDEGYLREARRVLDGDGVLVLITPDRKNRLFPTQRPWNRWHLREYARSELESLVRSCFQTVQMREMTARSDIAALELGRYRKVRWTTLPFTLPFLPESWRQAGLNWLHRITGMVRRDSPACEFDFAEEVFEFPEHAEDSLNLVVLAGSAVAGQGFEEQKIQGVE